MDVSRPFDQQRLDDGMKLLCMTPRSLAVNPALLFRLATERFARLLDACTATAFNTMSSSI